jgi:hypothetical protein
MSRQRKSVPGTNFGVGALGMRKLVPGTNFYPVDSKPLRWRELVPGTNFGGGR